MKLCHLLWVAGLVGCASTDRPSDSSESTAPRGGTAAIDPVEVASPTHPVRGGGSPAQPSKGRLLAVGGGGTTPEIIERALGLAGGRSARMLVVPQASSDPRSGEESRTFWMGFGAENVHVLDLTNEAEALREVAQADFIWIPGGDQSRLCEELFKTEVPAAIALRYREGALVGGTSAGAAALSRTMIIGGERADLKSVKAGGTEVTDGLDLSTSLIFDQHLVQRQRFTRLLACVLDHPSLVGVGIDEKTAVIVSGSTLEVIGESSVLVVDARGARVPEAAPGDARSARGVRLEVLKRGDVIDLSRPAP